MKMEEKKIKKLEKDLKGKFIYKLSSDSTRIYIFGGDQEGTIYTVELKNLLSILRKNNSGGYFVDFNTKRIVIH